MEMPRPIRFRRSSSICAASLSSMTRPSVNSISMSAGSIGPVKMMTRSLDVRQFRPLLDQTMHRPVETLRTVLRSYARDRGVAL